MKNVCLERMEHCAIVPMAAGRNIDSVVARKRVERNSLRRRDEIRDGETVSRINTLAINVTCSKHSMSSVKKINLLSRVFASKIVTHGVQGVGGRRDLFLEFCLHSMKTIRCIR